MAKATQKQGKDILSHAPIGASGEKFPEAFVHLNKKGTEGYIALGSILTSMIESKNFPDIEKYLSSISDEEMERIRSHSLAILNDGTERRLKLEISKRRDDLWIEASKKGVKDVLDGHRMATHGDTEHLIDSVSEFNKKLEKSGSILSQIKNGIISGIALGIFLWILGKIDNPLAQFFDTLWG